MKRLLLFCLFTAIATPLSATNYYIAASGSDANPGTKVSPWLHAPGMNGCTSNCASTTPTGGDAFIFRGGDTWHNVTGSPTGLKWHWEWSGSSGNTIYIGGGDQTWDNGSCSAGGIVDTNGTTVLLAAYGESTVGTSSHPFEAASVWNASSSWPGKTIVINGASYTIASVEDPYRLTLTTSAGTQRSVAYSTGSTAWCRPILNGDKAAVTGNASDDGNVITATGTYYLTFDKWEIRGCYATAFQLNNGQSSCIQWEPLQPLTPYTLSNLYIHDWAHATFSSTVPNNEGWYLLGLGSQSTYGQGQEIAYLTIDGSDSLDTTFYNKDTNMMQNCASGNVPGGAPVAQYWLEGKCPTASGVGLSAYNYHHSRIKYVQNGMVVNNPFIHHDNVFEHIYNVWDINGNPYHDNVSEFNGEFIGAGNPTIYNNVYRYNTTAVSVWFNPESGTTISFFNNILYANLSEDIAQDPTSGGSVVYYNNTLVITSGSPVGVAGKSTFINNHWITPGGTSNKVGTETFAVAMTPATAAAQGYTSSTGFAPTSALGATVNTGSNLTTTCITSPALCNTTSAGDTVVPNARPASGAWNVGAWQFGGSPPPPTQIKRPRINNSSLPPGVVGTTYSTAFDASDGVPPYTWSGVGFPPGLQLSAAGVLSGTPTTAGAYAPLTTVVDTINQATSLSLPLVITATSSCSVTCPAGPPGPQGIQGIQGVQGPQGPQGPPGAVAHGTILSCTRVGGGNSSTFNCKVP